MISRHREIELGSSGLTAGPQGLGCMGMSEFYGPTDQAEARNTLEHALDNGVTMFDTADMYGHGANEEFLAPFFRAHRDEVVIATKFGIVRAPENPSARSMRGDREYVRRAAEASLRRLDVDTIDLYYMHRRDPSVSIEETVGAMAELVSEGKVRYLGLSEVTGDELRAADAVHPISAVQSEWSVFNRDVERTIVPAAVELGVGFVPYSPLGRGFLAGAFASAEQLTEDDGRRGHPQFVGDNARHNAALLEPLNTVAARHGVSAAQVALAWVHARSRVHELAVVPIPGTRRRSRLDENLAAPRLELSTTELDSLESIAAQVAGPRYADMNFTSAGREKSETGS
ncbi:aryl-alcohol dehydrogenase-like predicted oxidoreductase [Saccharopolyspora lacisalsi]|uniref:Aryl-alcohol dehydrogenase-like predicted oxidoreductase n=1 Tax=Halosaccharopolyspora lacisalsi TaxID=1000566 RepID=A0A839E137_9PSEU|nr:aldo/keto reductase [Halosaccharopolyspora lacisalsi]MBA8826236.1 aryl-alcohol dehydrogenase-like predicted oxidoreductase [Halosaccharopolyspora lacisalsi]